MAQKLWWLRTVALSGFVFSLLACTVPEQSVPTEIPATKTATPVVPETKLEEIQTNGAVRCGVYLDYPGFAHIDYNGTYAGLDMDICRALAVAIFDNVDATVFDGFVMAEVSAALEANTVDVVMHSPRPQLGIENPNLGYAKATYTTGAGLLVADDFAGWHSLHDVPTCALPIGDFEPQLDPLFVAAGDQDLDLEYEPAWPRLYERYNQGECQALILPRPMLIEARRQMSSDRPSRVLPLTFDLQPVGPIVWTVDPNWIELVNAVIDCLNQPDAEIDFSNVGLTETTCSTIISKIGTYTDIYERNLGANSSNPLPVAEEIAN